jgi:hypothetical protein
MVAFAIAIGITVTLGAGLSEAQKMTPPAKAVGTMRATSPVNAQSFGHLDSSNLHRPSSGRPGGRNRGPGSGIGIGGKIGPALQGPAASEANMPRISTFSTYPGNRGTMRPKDPYTALPDVQGGETINDPTVMSPSDRYRDPSDIFDFEDMKADCNQKQETA